MCTEKVTVYSSSSGRTAVGHMSQKTTATFFDSELGGSSKRVG